MATSNSRKRSSGSRTTNTRKRSASAQRRPSTRYEEDTLDYAVKSEISLILFAALAIFLFLCNFKICGTIGNAVSDILFGIFGLAAYVMPLVFFAAGALLLSNGPSPAALRKIFSGLLILLVLSMLFELITGRVQAMDVYKAADIYSGARDARNGGGFIAGSVTYAIYHNLSLAGTLIVMMVAGFTGISLFTQKSMLKGVKKGGKQVLERTRQEAELYRERMDERARYREEERARIEEERQLLLEQKEDAKILRMDKKVSGVSMDTLLDADDSDENPDDEIKEEIIEEVKDQEFRIHGLDFEEDDADDINAYIPEENIRDDIHEIRFKPSLTTEPQPDGQYVMKTEKKQEPSNDNHHITLSDDYSPVDDTYSEDEDDSAALEALMAVKNHRPVARLKEEAPMDDLDDIPIHSENIAPDYNGEYAVHSTDYITTSKNRVAAEKKQEQAIVKRPVMEYEFPPFNLLKKGTKGKGDSAKHLKDTARTLQDTLQMFHVNATVTDISQGPSVTRYELQPEAGVKVRKIVDLADDIKMHLAATDIRIEAPIPGKSAVGIEVPNKENSTVALRDLIESEEFQKSKSKLSVAIGKDIAGKLVITDISKMPHLLIAGATGSGKSVCINTIIMSIIYKASPEDVRLIMIDPKIVELSVYNGIPHLLIPVVTDPKKAAAALNWAVSEMTTRYKKFANAKVRDLKGYNALCEHNDDPDYQKMPEIVVIVDELADLMMQFKNEVEDSIVRLTQLARAAGIYLIIATQRPSVDVITGLIKANIPSRIAFAVSSGVDSRTILDSYGAEKLIGKGDMLFFPRGYNKPARVQGCFVSDDEVQSVTDFVKTQGVETGYGHNVSEEISSMEVATKSSQSASVGDSSDGASDLDPLFAQAGAAIIEKEKASIGMLQRLYKIGFNRAARIMDQLSDAGVVGPEEGTKPRRILMTKEEFEQLIDNAS
ncbi:FtsK/SpoIIIE family DNA translocase [Butyrivibrio sp. VCD2006]|uniref:FtsK/SpoIIIE family DNA translocase n=1 Tax=Butyrivibrio sp. VCD2006 TaxID=1280664 RepID=UPI0003F78606|nr:DNA translocase FtsK [Butyrivibrio sp. VCD2006]